MSWPALPPLYSTASFSQRRELLFVVVRPPQWAKAAEAPRVLCSHAPFLMVGLAGGKFRSRPSRWHALLDMKTMLKWAF